MAINRNIEYSGWNDAPKKSSPMDIFGNIMSNPITSVAGNVLGSLVGGIFGKRGSDQAYRRLVDAANSMRSIYGQGRQSMQGLTNPYILGNLGMYQQGTDYAQNMMRDISAGNLPSFMNTGYDRLMRRGTIASQGTGNPLYGSTTGEQTRSMAAENMMASAQQYAPNLLMSMFGLGQPMQQAGVSAENQYWNNLAGLEEMVGTAGAQKAVNNAQLFGNMAQTVGGIPQDYTNAILGKQMRDMIPTMFMDSVRNNPGTA